MSQRVYEGFVYVNTFEEGVARVGIIPHPHDNP